MYAPSSTMGGLAPSGSATSSGSPPSAPSGPSPTARQRQQPASRGGPAVSGEWEVFACFRRREVQLAVTDRRQAATVRVNLEPKHVTDLIAELQKANQRIINAERAKEALERATQPHVTAPREKALTGTKSLLEKATEAIRAKQAQKTTTSQLLRKAQESQTVGQPKPG